MAQTFLDQQLANYIAPERPDIQPIIQRLSSELFKGHSCIQLEPQELARFNDFTHPGLVIEDDRLYLKRYAQYETQLAQTLLRLAAASSSQPPSQPSSQPLPANDQPDSNARPQTELDHYSSHQLKQLLEDHFTDLHQAKAAQLALTESLAIITGGPGTGKTTTVVKILALLLQQNPNALITLCAPTGKAAMRLQASISGSKHQLTGFAQTVLDKIPENVLTIHRLLGAKPFSTEFKHHPKNPLLADIVVVDEASMIDLALMTKLVEALPPHGKLILLGDKDQLASVESGAVLADCYEALQSHRVALQTTYRFGGKIKQLADAVNQQASDLTLEILENAKPEDPIAWVHDEHKALQNLIKHHYQAYFEVIERLTRNQPTFADAQTGHIQAAFQAFAQFQILTATHQGKYGVDTLNALCEGLSADANSTWYAGRPVMITRNDSNVGLFNGDIGLCLPNLDSSTDSSTNPIGDGGAKPAGELRVFFESPQGIRSLPISRMPEHQTAYAMTIHKSQGSEFAKVLIVLPEQMPKEAGFITKELLYTAITRGKQQVMVHAPREVLQTCINQKVSRLSGLKHKLRALHE